MVRSHTRWFLTLAVALLGAVPAVSAQAPRLTLDELIKNGAQYQDRIVQLRGQLDNCYSSCNFCPEGTTTETFDDAICLSLVFGAQVPGDALPSGTAHDSMAMMYRFAVVTLEAQFTAACIFANGKLVYGAPNNPFFFQKGADKQEGGCFIPRPADLSEARIVQVHARRTLVDGLIDPQSIYDELVAPDPDERAAILAEWDRTQVTKQPEIFTVKDKQMAADFAVSGDNYDGLACWCNEASCDGKWPTHLVFSMNSPANPFFCWVLKKTPEGWRVLPDGV
jgi:hypothetical protein